MRGNRSHPIYKGIDRAALWQGLPTIHVMMILAISALVSIFAPAVVALGTGGVLLVLLKALYAWEPQFLSILRVTYLKTPLTRNRKRYGGHFYDA